MSRGDLHEPGVQPHGGRQLVLGGLEVSLGLVGLPMHVLEADGLGDGFQVLHVLLLEFDHGLSGGAVHVSLGDGDRQIVFLRGEFEPLLFGVGAIQLVHEDALQGEGVSQGKAQGIKGLAVIIRI